MNQLLSYNGIFIKRTANIAVISAERNANGLTGPMLRASGVDWDLRRDEPYSIYPKLHFTIPVGKGEKGQVGDNWDRYMVRVLEMYESVKILEQVCEEFRKDPSRAKCLFVSNHPKALKHMSAGMSRGEWRLYSQ